MNISSKGQIVRDGCKCRVARALVQSLWLKMYDIL